jgi:uncharacterized RDD family membrane protein YckC
MQMYRSWWPCEQCHSLNRPGTTICYRCHAPAWQPPSTSAPQGFAGATDPRQLIGGTGAPTSSWDRGAPVTPLYGGQLLPQSYGPAGMGRRVGAWLLDGFLVGLLAIIPLILGLVLGAVSFNRQALDQLMQIDPSTTDNPFALVTAPFLSVNVPALIVALAVYIGIHVAYFAGGWIRLGGTPAQRILGLRVADTVSGENLSIDQALLRWVVLTGISTVVSAIFAVVLFNTFATTPMNQLVGTGATGTALARFGALKNVNLISNLVSLGNGIWMLVMLISAGAHPLHRGLHDRIVGSIVLRPVTSYPAWPGYGYPPQAGPYGPGGGQGWPGYPPTPEPYGGDQTRYPGGPPTA